MKRMLLTGFILAGMGVIVSFAAFQPDWITGESKKYPKKDYILGVGIGYSVDAAKSAARAEIAKVFSVTIEQVSVDTNKESTSQKGSKKEFKSEVSAQTQTVATTTGTLEGVEIADTSFNRKTKDYYALAVLSKAKVRQRLSSQIEDQEEGIDQQVSTGKQASSNLEKVRAFSAALKMWDKKDELVAKRSVVDPAAVPDAGSAEDKAQVQAMRDKAINHIAFVVDAGSRPALGSLISSKLTDLGFKTLPSAPAQPDKSMTVILVKCTEDVEPFDRGNPNWKFYVWKVSTQMTEQGATNGNFATIAQQGESSHLSDDTAKNKAYFDAERTIVQSIEQKVRQNILGE